MRFIFEDSFPKIALSGRTMNELMERDIELCHTTSVRNIEAAVQVLLINQVPFTRKTVTIPFFLRKRFHNITEIHKIYIHPRCYLRACRALNQMPQNIRCRLVMAH